MSIDVDQLCHKATTLINELQPLEHKLLSDGPESIDSDLSEIRKRARTLGLWSPHLPKYWGGLDLPLPVFAYLSEVLGRSPLGHYACNCQAPDIGNMELLLEHGSSRQKKDFLGPLIEGKTRSCFAMTEPHNPGSNPKTLTTLAELKDGNYVINGHKWFASSAQGSEFAVVMAKTPNPDRNDYEQFSQIIVPTSTPGFERIRNISIMGDVGWGYFSHAELKLNDCVVPEENRIGAQGDGFALAQRRLGPGRIHHCMRWLGIAQRALEMTCKRAVNRSMGSGQFIRDRQVVRHWIAESRAEIHGARLMVLDAADQVAQKGSKGARIAISIIKFHVAGVMLKVLDRAIQVHGGLGMTDDTLLSFWYRHERASRIYDGPDEVHKDVVARATLREFES